MLPWFNLVLIMAGLVQDKTREPFDLGSAGTVGTTQIEGFYQGFIFCSVFRWREKGLGLP